MIGSSTCLILNLLRSHRRDTPQWSGIRMVVASMLISAWWCRSKRTGHNVIEPDEWSPVIRGGGKIDTHYAAHIVPVWRWRSSRACSEPAHSSRSSSLCRVIANSRCRNPNSWRFRRPAFRPWSGTTMVESIMSTCDLSCRQKKKARIPVDWSHSVLSATIGSTLVARRAGTRHAAMATSVRMIGAMTSVAGSVASTPKRSFAITALKAK
jgi:hypothetical protein